MPHQIADIVDIYESNKHETDSKQKARKHETFRDNRIKNSTDIFRIFDFKSKCLGIHACYLYKDMKGVSFDSKAIGLQEWIATHFSLSLGLWINFAMLEIVLDIHLQGSLID